MRRKSLGEVGRKWVGYEVDDIVRVGCCVGEVVWGEGRGDKGSL